MKKIHYLPATELAGQNSPACYSQTNYPVEFH